MLLLLLLLSFGRKNHKEIASIGNDIVVTHFVYLHTFMGYLPHSDTRSTGGIHHVNGTVYLYGRMDRKREKIGRKQVEVNETRMKSNKEQFPTK